MELATLKRHLPSIDEGRWVGADEVPALAEIRVKVRGASATKARDLHAAKLRSVPASEKEGGGLKPAAYNRILMEMLAEWNLVEIEGLTSGGKPVTADEVRKLVLDPACQPLADLIMQAVAKVDATREAQIEELSGN